MPVIGKPSRPDWRNRLHAPFLLGGILQANPPADVVAILGRKDERLRQVIALAARHCMRGALWLGLCRHGLMAPLPQALRARLPFNHALLVLEEGWNIESRKSLAVLDQAKTVILALNQANIRPMVLKGMGLVLSGIVAQPGQRWMVDIDFLIPVDQLSKAIAVLQSIGYHGGQDFAPHHAPPMVPLQGGGEVELHHHLVVPKLQAAFPLDDVWNRAVWHRQDGLEFAVAAPQDAILHNVLHAQDSCFVFEQGRIPVRHLADFAALSCLYGADIDWNALEQKACLVQMQQAFQLHLYQADQMFGAKWPLSKSPALTVKIRWGICLSVCAFPWPIGRLLTQVVEIRQILGQTAPDRNWLFRLLACGGVILRVILKYRGRLWKRLMGPRRR